MEPIAEEGNNLAESMDLDNVTGACAEDSAVDASANRSERLSKLRKISQDVTEKLVQYFDDRWLSNSDAQIHDSVECLPEKFLKSLQHIVHTEANIQRRMCDKNAFLPYQDTIPQEIKDGIDDGSLDLHGLCCHPTFGCKYVDADVVKGPAFEALYIPSNMLHGFSVRHLHAVLADIDKSGVRGEKATKVKFDTLWNATSPELPKESAADASDTRRFGLTSSILAMRSAAMAKRTKSFDSFVHYDHPQNNVCGVQGERISRSGQLYNGTAALAKAYNASMCMCYGKPQVNTAAYNEFIKTQFSTEEAKAVCGAVARLYNKQPQRTVELANICFNNRYDPNIDGKHKNSAKLYRHITSLRSAEDVEQSLQLNRSKGKEWTDLSNNPELCEHVDKLCKDDHDTFRIGNPYNFPWIEPRLANNVNGWENGQRVEDRAYTKSAMERKTLRSWGKDERYNNKKYEKRGQFYMSSQSKPFYPRNHTRQYK